MIVFIMYYVSVLVIFRAAMGMKTHVLMGIGHQVNFSDGSGTDLNAEHRSKNTWRSDP